MTRYIPGPDGTVGAVPKASYTAPAAARASLVNKPNQSMPTFQPAPQNFEVDQDSMIVANLAAQINATAAVQTIEVRQPSFKLAAPKTAWNRLNWQMQYITGRQDRYPSPGLAAPPRLQSIPGFVVKQSQVTTSGINATQARIGHNLRAPRANERPKG